MSEQYRKWQKDVSKVMASPIDPQEIPPIRSWIDLTPREIYRILLKANREELERILRELEEERRVSKDPILLEFLDDLEALVTGCIEFLKGR